MAVVHNTSELAFSMVLLGVGQGLLSPSVSGLLSRITPMNRQGAIFGTLTSAQTLARLISYSAANILLSKVSTAAPYWGAFGIDVLALVVAIYSISRLFPQEPAADGVADVLAAEQVAVDGDP